MEPVNEENSLEEQEQLPFEDLQPEQEPVPQMEVLPEQEVLPEEQALLCTACNHVLNPESRFCPGCGALIQQVEHNIPTDAFERNGKMLAVFYMVTLGACLLSKSMNIFEDYHYLVWIEVFLAVWTIAFAWANIESIAPLYKLTNVKLPVMVLCAAGAVLYSLFVGAGVDWLNFQVFGMEFTHYRMYSDFDYGNVIFLLSVALNPAIFEELAFRGVVYNYVESFSGAFNAIVISSMAFAIMHVSVISLVWLVPFALVLGYLRYRYNTLWYGMVIHLFFNGTTCLDEILKSY